MKIPEMMEHYKENSNRQCGFVTEEDRNSDETLSIPELNSGFDTVYWYRGSNITSINYDEHGFYVEASKELSKDWDKGYSLGLLPMIFKVHVEEEGNYKVTVGLYATETVEEALIFIGRRRLAFCGRIEAGANFVRTFVTNVCPVIPRGKTEVMDDESIDVTIIGNGLRLTKIDICKTQCPTIYIAGDSTVTDQSADYPYNPGCSYSGWGQMLSNFTGEQVAVSNHAHSGLTTESFGSEGHYQILYDRIKPGDICLIQFGHNDQKLMELKAFEGYAQRLVTYIEEIRNKQGIPVLVTPLARNSWRGNDETYNDLLEEYDRACKEIAKKYEVHLIGLHDMSMELIIRMGRENAKRYFFPSDYTHSNDYGAFLFGKYVYEELVKCGEFDLKPVENLLNEDLMGTAKWNPPDNIIVPIIPDKFKDTPNPGMENIFANLDRPQDLLTRVEALDFVIKTMHFFPTNVYNDTFTDVIGHETYAGTVECACQNGLIPEEMIVDGKFEPNKPILEKEFSKLVWNGYKSRKKISADDFQKLMGKVKGDFPLTRDVAANICSGLHI